MKSGLMAGRVEGEPRPPSPMQVSFPSHSACSLHFPMFLLHFKQVGGRERKRPQAGIILLNSPITAENIFHFCCEILNGKRQYHRRCWRRYFGQSYWSLLMCPEGKGRRSQPGGRARTRAHTHGGRVWIQTGSMYISTLHPHKHPQS